MKMLHWCVYALCAYCLGATLCVAESWILMVCFTLTYAVPALAVTSRSHSNVGEIVLLVQLLCLSVLATTVMHEPALFPYSIAWAFALANAVALWSRWNSLLK